MAAALLGWSCRVLTGLCITLPFCRTHWTGGCEQASTSGGLAHGEGGGHTTAPEMLGGGGVWHAHERIHPAQPLPYHAARWGLPAAILRCTRGPQLGPRLRMAAPQGAVDKDREQQNTQGTVRTTQRKSEPRVPPPPPNRFRKWSEGDQSSPHVLWRALDRVLEHRAGTTDVHRCAPTDLAACLRAAHRALGRGTSPLPTDFLNVTGVPVGSPRGAFNPQPQVIGQRRPRPGGQGCDGHKGYDTRWWHDTRYVPSPARPRRPNLMRGAGVAVPCGSLRYSGDRAPAEAWHSLPGGATTNGPDATTPPSYLSKLGGGGGSWGGSSRWSGGGVFLPGVGGGCSYRTVFSGDTC